MTPEKKLVARSPLFERLSFVLLFLVIPSAAMFLGFQEHAPILLLNLVILLVVASNATAVWGYWQLSSSPPCLTAKGIFKKQQFKIADIYEVRDEPASSWDRLMLGGQVNFTITMRDGTVLSRSESNPGIEELVVTLVDFCRSVSNVIEEDDLYIRFESRTPKTDDSTNH